MQAETYPSNLNQVMLAEERVEGHPLPHLSPTASSPDMNYGEQGAEKIYYFNDCFAGMGCCQLRLQTNLSW